MAAVVASKVKRQRQLAAEQKNADTPGAESQLIQRRAASASREAAERRKLSQYYSQVEGDLYYFKENISLKRGLGCPLCFSIFIPMLTKYRVTPQDVTLLGHSVPCT